MIQSRIVKITSREPNNTIVYESVNSPMAFKMWAQIKEVNPTQSASGFMIPQYTAASIVSQSKGLCWPASCDSIPSSQGQEDHVSMGSNAATKLWKVVQNTERVLAIEIMNSAQALEFRHQANLRSSDKVEAMFEAYRKVVPFVDNDTVMYPHIATSVKFLNDYELAR